REKPPGGFGCVEPILCANSFQRARRLEEPAFRKVSRGTFQGVGCRANEVGVLRIDGRLDGREPFGAILEEQPDDVVEQLLVAAKPFEHFVAVERWGSGWFGRSGG